MFDLIIKKCIRNYEYIERPSVRNSYGNLAGAIGLSVNLVLSALKLTIGYLTGSIAIISDGFHNLVDGASALVSIISFKLSGREPDIEHPYGHGRIEYIASLGMSVAVFVVGIQFMIESYKKIRHATPVIMDFTDIILFGSTLLGTIFLYFMYKNFSKRIDSQVLDAAGAECFADLISSCAILVGLVVGPLFHIQLDGYLGIVVAVLICHTGYEIFKESTSSLIGNDPKPEQVWRINEFVRSYEGVLGVHDLMIHDYGPGRVFASIHVEVDAKIDIIRNHELVDKIERDVKKELSINLTIHMDPVINDAKTLHTYHRLSKLIRAYNPKYSLQDLRMHVEDEGITLNFEIVVPFGEKKSHKEIRQNIKDLIEVVNPKYITHITIKECYTGLTNVHDTVIEKKNSETHD